MPSKFISVSFIISLLIGLSGAASSKAAEKEDNMEFAEFGSFLEEHRKNKHIRALTAMIVRDQKVVWEYAGGTADDEGEIATTMDTTFSIASVTKPIAAAAILKEAANGDLSLDIPLSSDPKWTGFCEWLSSSGIPFGSGGHDSDGTKIEPIDCARDLKLHDILNMRVNGKAGDPFVYNPITYARIDRAIEGAGGRPLRDIVRENVFDLAGITEAALGWHDPKGGSALRLLAPPFKVKDQGRTEKMSFSDDDFRAAAGIKASARHVALFDIALDRKLLLPADWMARIFTKEPLPERGDYRWGWFAEDWKDTRLFWHSGWDPDRYSALYLKVPEKNITLIVLANGEGLWWENELSRANIVKSPVAMEFLKRFASAP